MAQPREPIQAASEEIEETEPPGTEAMLPSVDATPSAATLYSTAPPDLTAQPDLTALPDLMDPQTTAVMDPPASTVVDPMQPIANDPLLTTVSTNVQNSTDGQSEIFANTVLTETHLTNQLEVTTTTYQGLTPDATTPFSPHTIKPSPQPSSATPPISVPIRASMTAVPVCFTLQFSTSEPEPPRGDSM